MTQVVMSKIGQDTKDSAGTGASVNAEAMKIFLEDLPPKLLPKANVV